MEGWLLAVIGKGQIEREVPVPLEVISELAKYLEDRGLNPDPRQGIAATTFYDQIKAFFADCAQVLRGQGDSKGAERFDKASTHWMRHSHASHAIASGMPIEIAQQNLGHASLATATVHVTTEKRRRMKAVEAFWKR